MLDRSVPPVFNDIKEFHLVQAESHQLANGIPIHTINIDQQPVVKLELIIPAGQWYESTTGQSYFAIKMLSEGTETRTSKYISNRFDQYGAFLELNPGFDHVTVTLYTLSKYLDELLPLLAEITYGSNFPAQELETLKSVKRQKIKVDQEKNSYLASRKFREQIFGPNHPYGSYLQEKHLDQIDRQSLLEFEKKRIPGPFEILLSGSIASSTLTMIDQHFGGIPTGNDQSAPQFNYTYKPERIQIEKENSLQTSIRVGKPLFKRDHKDHIDMLVLNEILGGYFGSRLMRNIREEKGYTYGIGSYVATLVQEGFWMISTDVKKEFRDNTISEIFKEMKLLTQHMVGQKELKTIKNYMLGSFLSEINTPFALAEKFKNVHFYGLTYEYYHKLFNRISVIEGRDLLQLAQKHWQEDSLSVVTVG